MKAGQNRAFSLTELLVGLAVFGLLAALIVGVFTLAQRYSRLNQQVSRAQRNVTQALQRLSFDLRRSYHPSLGPNVSNIDQCRMLSWQPTLSYDPNTGQPLYATWIAYWRSPNGELRRSQRPLSGGPLTTLQINLSLAPSMAMMQSASDQRKVLDSISFFRIERQDRLAQIELESRTSTPGNPDTHYRTTTCIPWNKCYTASMHKDRGYAIPLTLLVAGVILALGMSGATLSSSDLKLANQQYSQERARQIAEIGLALKAYQVAPASSDCTPAISAHPNDKVKVDVYDNRLGDLPANSGCPVTCPVGCMFWVATGRAYSGNQLLSEVRLGSLVRPGDREGSAGAQVRFLQATPGIHYSVISSTGVAASGGSVAATNNTLPGESPTAFLTSNRAIQMGNPTSATLLGQVKLSPGLAAGDFTDIAEAGLVSNTGGQFSLPPYAPPTLANNFGVLNVSASQNLAPGRYQQVTVQAGAVLRLNGCYHIGKLIVGSGGGQLHVALNDRAAVYLDELDTSSAPLDYRNLNKSSALRIELAPVAASSRQVALRAVNSGSALLVAPGHDVQISSDAEHKVRGSILAQQLKLDIPAGGEFIYDQSTEARPSTQVRTESAPAAANRPHWSLAGIRTL